MKKLINHPTKGWIEVEVNFPTNGPVKTEEVKPVSTKTINPPIDEKDLIQSTFEDLH